MGKKSVGIQLSGASKAFRNKVEIRVMNINQWEVECEWMAD